MTLYYQFLHLLPFLSFENLLGQTFLGMDLATTSIIHRPNLPWHGFGHNIHYPSPKPSLAWIWPQHPLSIAKKVYRGRTFGPYKGVRMRTWDKWVPEMRIPKSRERIWLGSYDAPEKAARAYDAAQYCIRGDQGSFNFPADKRPVLPQGSMVSLSKKDIQEIATNFASSESHISASCSSLVSSALPQVLLDNNSAPPNMLASRDMDGANESIGDSFAPTSIIGATASSPESLELDDFLLLDTERIDELI